MRMASRARMARAKVADDMTAKTASAPMTGEELTAYLTAVLDGIGAPATPWTLDWMRTWAASENTRAAFNPLASERPAPGHDSKFNEDGVRNYDSADVGIAATVETLGLSYYAPIVDSLRKQRFTNRRAILKAYQTWAGVSAPEAYHVASLIKGGWTPHGAKTLQAVEVPPASAPIVSGDTARKSVRDTALAAPLGVFALIDAATRTDWGVFPAELDAHHWGAVAATFLATPFALAVWRIVRARLTGQE